MYLSTGSSCLYQNWYGIQSKIDKCRVCICYFCSFWKYIIFSHSCCWLSPWDVWWDQPISHSPQYVSLISLILPYQILHVHTVSLGTAKWADLSTRHRIKSSPKGSGLVWWLVLIWAHLAFPAHAYVYNMHTRPSKCFHLMLGYCWASVVECGPSLCIIWRSTSKSREKRKTTIDYFSNKQLTLYPPSYPN